jgi:hypothetical protein
MDHDISPHSDHCINCGLSRYDAEGVICWPSTAVDSVLPETLEDHIYDEC